ENSVTVVNGSNDTVLKTISVGTSPCGIGINQITNKIYVTNADDNSVSVIEGLTDNVAKTITIPASMGGKPMSAVVDSSTDRVYLGLSTSDGAIPVVNGSSDTVIYALRAAQHPIMCATNPDTHILYAACLDGLIYAIDTTTGAVRNTVRAPGWGPLDPATN
ncbi:MAG: YncE family protein, partial [Candidatus Geothermincolia bacterium]